MPTTGEDRFHWAGKVSRREIRRVYASEAQGLLDEELLDQIMHTIHERVEDMFEVREAQMKGKVTCRNCREPLEDPYRMGSQNRDRLIRCPKCGWEVTCYAFFNSYSGKDLLPASRADLFQEFRDRYKQARAPREKMLLLDWLIHEFHIHSGITGRLVAQNVIQGSRDQLLELINGLAAGETGAAAKQAWLAEQNNPLRKFRQSHTHAQVREIGKQLGISGWRKMREDELIAEIFRLSPEMFPAE